MKFAEVVSAYLDYSRYQRGLRPKTLVTYTSWLHHFQDWLQINGYPDPTLEVFTQPILVRYLHSMAQRQLRPRTIRSAFFPLRGLASFLIDQGVIEENPVIKITLPKKDAAIRLLVTDEEVKRLLEACERQRIPRQVALSRAMISVLAYGGLRRQELLDLRLADVDLKDRSILVRSGKGSKSRKVFVCDACLTAVNEWLAFRRSPEHEKNEWLWAIGSARRVSAEGIHRIFETVKAIAGLREARVCPHALRHNCASRLMANGASLGAISHFLGHSSLSTTQIYLHVNEEQLRDIAGLGDFSSTPRSASNQPNAVVTNPLKAPTIRTPSERSSLHRMRRQGSFR